MAENTKLSVQDIIKKHRAETRGQSVTDGISQDPQSLSTNAFGPVLPTGKQRIDAIINNSKKKVESGLFSTGFKELGGLTLGALSAIPSTIRNTGNFLNTVGTAGLDALGFDASGFQKKGREAADQFSRIPENLITSARQGIGASETSQDIGKFIGDAGILLGSGVGALGSLGKAGEAAGAIEGLSAVTKADVLATTLTKAQKLVNFSKNIPKLAAGSLAFSSGASIQQEGRLATVGENTFGVLVDTALGGIGAVLPKNVVSSSVKWLATQLGGTDDIILKEMKANRAGLQALSFDIKTGKTPVLNNINKARDIIEAFSRDKSIILPARNLIKQMRGFVDNFNVTFKAKYQPILETVDNAFTPVSKEEKQQFINGVRNIYKKFKINLKTFELPKQKTIDGVVDIAALGKKQKTKPPEFDFSQSSFSLAQKVKNPLKKFFEQVSLLGDEHRTPVAIDKLKEQLTNAIEIEAGVNAPEVSAIFTKIEKELIEPFIEKHSPGLKELNDFYAPRKKATKAISAALNAAAAETKIAGLAKLGKGDFVKILSDFDNIAGSNLLDQIKEVIIEPSAKNEALIKRFNSIFSGKGSEASLSKLFEGEFKNENKTIVKEFDKKFGTDIFNEMRKVHAAQAINRWIPKMIVRTTTLGAASSFLIPPPLAATLSAVGLSMSSPKFFNKFILPALDAADIVSGVGRKILPTVSQTKALQRSATLRILDDL